MIPARERPSIPMWLGPAFLASGFAALIYQVVWQRVLFAVFGINIEAVTVVVTAFLLGLGFGSLSAGTFEKSRPRAFTRVCVFGAIRGGVRGRVGAALSRCRRA